MPGDLLLRRAGSPLRFPGRSPGFDPSHPAARGMSAGRGFSAVSSDIGFVNLLNGKVATPPSGLALPTSAGISLIGRAPWFPLSPTYGAEWQGNIAETPVNATFAFIARPTNSGAGSRTYFVFGGGFGLGVQNVTLDLVYDTSGSRTPITGAAVANNEDYFCVMSTDHSTILHGLTVNLRTGKVLYGTATPRAAVASSGNYTIGIGSTGIGFNSQAYMAAGMYSPSLLSKSEMLQWSEDPWAFWYPRRDKPVSFYYDRAAPDKSAVLPRRRRVLKSRLDYPGNVLKPGIDYSHVAFRQYNFAKNALFFSAVADGVSMKNLATGAGPTSTTGTATVRAKKIGPVLTTLAAGDKQTFAYNTVSIGRNVNLTIAAIFNCGVLDYYNSTFFSNDTGGGYGISWNNYSSPTFSPLMTGITTIMLFPSMVSNHNYFCAISREGVPSGSNAVNGVLLDLDTGQVWFGTGTATTGAFNNTAGTVSLGNTNGPNRGAQIAAIAAIPSYLSLADLAAWAEDPWSFWYPRQPAFDVGGVYDAAPGSALARFRRTLSRIGTGVGRRQTHG